MDRLRQDFKKGEQVIADKDFRGGYNATVVNDNNKSLFTTITVNGKDSWDIMTIRLTKIENNE